MSFISKIKKCWRILTAKPQVHEDKPTAERKKLRDDAERYLKILQNIEAYDGTSNNQQKI